MAIKGKVLLNFNQARDNIVGKGTKIYLYWSLHVYWETYFEKKVYSSSEIGLNQPCD
jgi:hypothetical protein